MIIISSVRLRKWLPWIMRFVFIMTLIYLLTAAFNWFESASYSATPQHAVPQLFAQMEQGPEVSGANMPG